MGWHLQYRWLSGKNPSIAGLDCADGQFNPGSFPAKGEKMPRGSGQVFVSKMTHHCFDNSFDSN